MRLGRIQLADGSIHLARLDGDVAVPLLEQERGPGRDPLRDALARSLDWHDDAGGREPIPMNECRVLAPVAAPQKVVAIGLNYRDHAREAGVEIPAAPVVFVKTPNSIVGPEDTIRYHKRSSDQVDYEVELAVVIGRRATRVTEADALSFVLGYTVCNDVSARDAQFADGQWVRGKSFDTFCPLGPWIVTADEIPDVQDLALRCRVNGNLLQDGSTSDMIFGVAEIISYLSRDITLEPGDVIATGTPAGVGFTRTPPIFLRNNDIVETEIDNIGLLRNPVEVV